MDKRLYTESQTYFKPNYDEALKYLVPNYILEDEDTLYDKEVNPIDQIINCHIDFADNINSTLNISAIEGTSYSSINTIQGIANYFIKQNRLSEITPDQFELNILGRVNQSFNKFKTVDAFSSYVLEDLLPSIHLNKPTEDFTLGENPSSTHIYLIQNLSWLYFLNTSGPSYSPSSLVAELICDKLYFGKSVLLNDCIKGLNEYIWKNNLTDYYPSLFVSSSGKYTSGTQQLDKLNTWADIVYSPLYSDKADFTVYDRFLDYINSNYKQENYVSKGPFTKLLKALSFAAHDYDNFTTQLKSLNSIENCPAEYLPFLADLIGWRLFGYNPDRWRLQLRNAIEIYKKAGTKKSLQVCLNTVFPKDSFSIESDITELWESYIPHLIYYALATDSEYFKSYDIWTVDKAQLMGVVGYSNESMDENIKLSVDRILFEIYSTFRQSFEVPFAREGYFYRGRQYRIPPFEEYPYYINIEVNWKILNFIEDRLVCFGVSKEFAKQVRDYIELHTISKDADTRSFGWLFFTSGYNSPPNLDNVIATLSETQFDYVSLWSGKSSHFKLILDTEDFDFTKKEIDAVDSGNAIQIASQIINDFAPAHAIPLVTLQLNASDTMESESYNLPIANYNKEELVSLGNLETSAFVADGSVVGNAPRNTLRKRSYEDVFPKVGYYDRTGFNMPICWNYSNELSGLPLGLIPSSLQYQTISNYNNIPEVYYYCNDNESNKSFYGYPVSSTLKARGISFNSSGDYYCDRGQLPDIYYAIHEIEEARKYYEASGIIYSAIFALNGNYDVIVNNSWLDIIKSHANTLTEVYGWFPNSITNYYDYDFGTDLHKLYKIYTTNFQRHQLNERYHYVGGPNIFSHTFGPIVSNYDFELGDTSQFITSISSTNKFTPGVDPFTFSGTGTYVASSTSSNYIGTYELVNSSILTNIELVMTSGSNSTNSLSVIRLSHLEKPEYANDYMFEKSFVRMYSTNGLARIRFDLNKYDSNFLIPNHEFKLNINSLVSNFNGLQLGGKTVGVWVHTKDEAGKIWSFDKNKKWSRHNSLISKTELFNNYTHFYSFEERSRSEVNTDETLSLKCIEMTINGENQNQFLTLNQSDFRNFELEFHTYNRRCDKPKAYYHPGKEYSKLFGDLHRLDQKYVVEIFLVPENTNIDKFLLLDKVEIIDLTMNKMSKPIIFSGCPDIRMDLSKYQLQSMFKFWNDIAGKNSNGGLASRVDTITDDVMLTNGGSRLDYRVDSSWYSPTKISGLITTLRINI